MGKVLKLFGNGYAGSISRSVDNVVISLRNSSDAAIPFGTPVFLAANEKSCHPYTNGDTVDNFLGFAVRNADKTPDTYGSNQAAYQPNAPVDILVRGTIVLHFTGAVPPNSSVYLMKADGTIKAVAPATASDALELPNCHVNTPRDSGANAEVILAKRNLM